MFCLKYIHFIHSDCFIKFCILFTLINKCAYLKLFILNVKHYDMLKMEEQIWLKLTFLYEYEIKNHEKIKV